MSIIDRIKNLSFKRLTSGGKFIPEIDGLRFIAVFAVVLYHANYIFMNDAIAANYQDNYQGNYIFHLFKQGNYGVEIFFIISGFILALPFIKIFSKKQGSLNLKKYFTRRLTRLEPPYIILMIGLFFAYVLSNKLPLQEALKSLGCSLLYIHNFVYGLDTLPLLNGVAWSLEIEVQFYILAPLLSTVFLISDKVVRRVIIISTGLLFSILGNTIQLPFLSLYDYIEYFAIGFLLADLYIYRNNDAQIPNIPFKTILSLIILFTIFLIDPIQGKYLTYITDIAQLGLLFIFFYGVLFLKSFPALSHPFLTGIGGMCYTIYLLNTYVISISGGFISKFQFTPYYWIDFIIYGIFMLTTLLFVSSIYFLLIERPCMDKDWPKKLMSYIGLRNKK